MCSCVFSITCSIRYYNPQTDIEKLIKQRIRLRSIFYAMDHKTAAWKQLIEHPESFESFSGKAIEYLDESGFHKYIEAATRAIQGNDPRIR